VLRSSSFWQPRWWAPPPAHSSSPRRASPRASSPARVVARLKVGFGPSNPAIAADGTVFVPNHGEGTVSRIDPALNRVVATWKVGPAPFTAALAFGDVWVPTSYATSVVRIRVG
jgi:YVTN family beta-propeller protein